MQTDFNKSQATFEAVKATTCTKIIVEATGNIYSSYWVAFGSLRDQSLLATKDIRPKFTIYGW